MSAGLSGSRALAVDDMPTSLHAAARLGAPAEVRREVIVDGLRAAVFESGAGEPCLLLHGYPESHWCWRSVAGALATTRRLHKTVIEPQ